MIPTYISETTLFHQHGKKTRPPHSKPRHDLTAMATPNTLLAEGRRPGLLQNIMASCALDSSIFNNLCVKLIHNFVNHCQRLPETANNYYSLPGGFLDHALNRTEAALQLFRHLLVQGHEKDMSEEQKLWLYALFSAGILQGIGKLQLDYRVTLFDMNGRLLKPWNPLLESLAFTGGHYDFEFLRDSEDDLRRRLNLVLAYQLMPKRGFEWIAGNAQVLAIWLALIHEDPNSAGMLGATLERAKAISIQRDLSEFQIKHAGITTPRSGRISTFMDVAPETSIEKDRLLGAEFLAWLTQKLKKGHFCMNKIPVMMMPAGIIVSHELFLLFMKEHPEVKHWHAVRKGLLAWGLHRRGRADLVEKSDEHNEQDSIVLDKYAVILPDEMQRYNPETGKTSTLSALELIHMQQTAQHSPLQHLSLSGEWLVMETNMAELRTGFIHHE